MEGARCSAAVSKATEVPVPRRKRPIAFEQDFIVFSDPAPHYPDVIALGSLSSAIRAAGVEQGLSIPPKAFRSIGRDTVRPDPLYGLTVHSRLRRREGLRVTASRHRRAWRIEGGQAVHRVDGTTPELAEVARIAHAWHGGTALADIHQLAPCVAPHAVDYRYFGFGEQNSAPGEPSSVVRTWIDASGIDQEETFTDSLTWERTQRLSPVGPHDDPDPVEIDKAKVDRFIHSATEHIRAERRRR
ncbi:hypothetical protein ACIBSW_11120 [Actinoplanes sp. NPDC049668]|uniref:hypothetical protein n=1 Tax=unclassified Actinoplanes TaxID=2626549 RepID=UPI00339DAC66